MGDNMFKPLKGLNNDQIKKIQLTYPTLKAIQNLTNVPWQALAGVWYRESFSIAPPPTPGGSWQFDPVPPSATLRSWLNKYTDLSVTDKEKRIKTGVNDFETGCLFAACLLQHKVKGQLTLNSSDALIKDALWGYNGRAYGSADNSPYVMNGYDKEHYPLRLIGTIPDGKGGRIKINNPDLRPGAFVIYKQLKELFP